MDLTSITKDLKDTNDYRLDQRFDKLMRTNPRYKNLNGENRELIMDLILKYKNKIREHNYPSSLTIRHDTHHLYMNRVKLGLTYHDLDQIKELLQSFKE